MVRFGIDLDGPRRSDILGPIMSLPTDYNERKAFPLLTVLTAYFADAIEALVALCCKGNVQHSVDEKAVNPFRLPEDTITWDRSKSTDQLNTLMRHLWDHTRAKRGLGSFYDTDGVLHITKAFWRAGAETQLTIEKLRQEGVESLGHLNQLPVEYYPHGRPSDRTYQKGRDAQGSGEETVRPYNPGGYP